MENFVERPTLAPPPHAESGLAVLLALVASGTPGCVLFKKKSKETAAAKIKATEAESTDEAQIARSRDEFTRAVDAYYNAGQKAEVSADPAVAGKWEVVRQTARMQAIHMAAFPSDPDAEGNPTGVKVLVVNGSSNRNNANPNHYADVDNAGVYDPKANLFARIPAAPRPGVDRPGIDLFCTGHVHTFAGDVLFAGGTQGYNPGFTGIRTLWRFDWRKAAFEETGLEMADGRWYPTLQPLGDGRIAIIGGMSDRRPDEISRVIETYDPVPATPVLKRWPKAGDGFAAGIMDGKFAYMGGQWDMYPRLIATRGGRHLLTGDGTGAGNRFNRNTLFLSFSGPDGDLSVTMDDGPNRGGARGVANKFYGTHIFDPRPGREGEHMILGGQVLSDVFDRPGDENGAQTTVEMDRYTPPRPGLPLGEFTTEDDFLGGFGVNRNPDGTPAGGLSTDRRLNHVAVFLPTGDFVVLGGGNYGYRNPMFNTLVYRATEDLLPGDATKCDFGTRPGQADGLQKQGYCRLLMNPHTFPRLYHTSAVLLPDGSVFLGGGNAFRGVWDGDTPGDRDLLLTEGQGLFPANPAEVHFFEVFKPPYMYAAGRPRIVQISTKKVAYGENINFTVEGAPGAAKDAKVTFVKLGSVTHSWDVGQRFANLAFTISTDGRNVQATAPVAADSDLYPPGYYMMFFVDRAKGIPSEAQIVQLLPERVKASVK